MGTGYHFHNFFSHAQDIRFKYHTYGHPIHRQRRQPMWEYHEDLQMAFNCANGIYTSNDKYVKNAVPFDTVQNNSKPIYYLNKENRNRRHSAWQRIVREEQKRFAN